MALPRLFPPTLLRRRPARAVALFGGLEQMQDVDLAAVLSGDAAMREVFDRCEAAARRLGLGPIPRATEAIAAPADVLGYRPAAYLTLTALQIALFEREQARRGEPPAVYSLCGGHAAAAHAAGALDLDGAMRLAGVYATLVETWVRPAGSPGNGEGLWVLDGAARIPTEAYEATQTAPAVLFSDAHVLVVGHNVPGLAHRLDALGVSYRHPRGARFPTAHTALFDFAEASFRAWCRDLAAAAPTRPWHSAAGTWVREVPDASFWWGTVAQPVRCGRDAALLAGEGFTEAIEMGRTSAVGTYGFRAWMEVGGALGRPSPSPAAQPLISTASRALSVAPGLHSALRRSYLDLRKR